MRLPKRSRTRANGMVVWRCAFQLPCRAVVPQSRDERGSASQISAFGSTLFEPSCRGVIVVKVIAPSRHVVALGGDGIIDGASPRRISLCQKSIWILVV